jgi:signal peptidase II
MASRPRSEAAAGGRDGPGLRRPLFFTLVLALFAADLATKAWAFDAVGHGGSAPLLGSWLSIYCITNSGGIWGMLQDLTLPLTLVRLVAVGVLVFFVSRQPRGNRLGLFVLALLLAGALGNLYDNLSRWLPWPGNGHVRDFVMVNFAEPGWWPDALAWPFDPWPIFNFADSCIFVGFILLLTGAAHLQVRRPASG